MDHQLTRSSSHRRVTLRAVLGATSLLVMFAACRRSPAVTHEPINFRIPRDAARFSISAATDSTVTFRTLEANWLRVGMRGHAVDPTQRDALIARLTIQQLDSNGVTAMIDGRVAQVSTTHVVLMVKPEVPWWRDRRFWVGAGTGAVTGVLIGRAIR